MHAMAAPFGRRALLAAAVAAQGRVFGLTAISLASGTRGSEGEQPAHQAKADLTSREEIDRWLDEASEANEALEQETLTILDEIAKWTREDPRARKEQELEMLEDLLAKWDAENETGVEETARRMAAIAFRQELQALAATRGTHLTPSKQVAWRMASTPSKAPAHLSSEARADYGDPSDAVDPTDTMETSEARESLLTGLVTNEFRHLEAAKKFSSLAAEELMDDWPRDKKVRRRHYRPAPHASKRKREMVAQAIENWLPEAAKEASDIDKVYTSVNRELLEQLENTSKELVAEQELLNQLDNVSAEQEEDVIPEADKDLAILQGIWDKYELENNDVSAEDLAESLHLIQDPGGWYSEALRALHQGGKRKSEPPEIAELRRTVERLESELEVVEDELKEELAPAPEHMARALEHALRSQTTEAVAALIGAKIKAHIGLLARVALGTGSVSHAAAGLLGGTLESRPQLDSRAPPQRQPAN